VKVWAHHRRTATPRARGPTSAREVRTRAPRPIWLPQCAEPVTLLLTSGEKLPARVLERDPTTLVLAIVVPADPPTEAQLRHLVLEYSNPGGCVRLSGRITVVDPPEAGIVRVEDPPLIEVTQERKHVRVHAECPVVLRARTLSEPITTHSVDLSTGGMLLAGPQALYVGQRLSFQLAIAPGTPPLEGTVEVARIDEQGRAGVKFVAIGQADIWRLVSFTVECQREESFRHPSLDGHLAGDSAIIHGRRSGGGR
jgi:PilZ domain